MCITLGGGGPKCEPVVPPTEAAKKHRIVLIVLGGVQLVLAIMLCWVNLMSGIYEIIDVMMLACAVAQMNYCCLTFYIVYITINFFTYVNIIGLVIQTQSLTTQFSSNAATSPTYQFTVICLLTAFYIVAIILCFFAYREFKGMLFDHGMGGNFGMGMMGQQQQPGGAAVNQSQDVRQNQNQQRQQYYQQQRAAQPQQSQPSSGFRAFQGQGVAIGSST